MAGYLGAIPVPQATQHRESFTATSGQTTFATAGYTVGFLDVYLNGSHLSPADFTATNGSDVVLASGASADDVCDIISYTAFEVADQTFTGTTTMDVAAITGSLNVDGTVTADGLTVDGNTTLTGSQPLTVNTTGNNQIRLQSGGTAFGQAFGATGIDWGFTDDSGSLTRMVIDSSGNVGIGTSSPSEELHIYKNTTNSVDLKLENSEGSATLKANNDSFYIDADNHVFRSEASSERMRIDSSGNVLVGTTDAAVGSSSSVTGGVISAAGIISNGVDGNVCAVLNRQSSDGEILRFRKDGTTVGSMGSIGTGLYIAAPSNGGAALLFNDNANPIYPAKNNSGTVATADNYVDLGASALRFDDIFATNGTIQTSDRNEKQDIAALTSAEMLVAKRISALFKTFRWKDKVAEKGDNARTHTGIIAQDVQAAFTAESLDAGDYALFISTTWWEHDVEVPAVEAADAVYEDVVIAAVEEELDEEGNVSVEAQEERTEQRVTTEAVEAVDAYTRTDTYDTEDEAPEGATSKTRMGIRYPELLSFVAAYNEQRFASIETRLTALEG